MSYNLKPIAEAVISSLPVNPVQFQHSFLSLVNARDRVGAFNLPIYPNLVSKEPLFGNKDFQLKENRVMETTQNPHYFRDSLDIRYSKIDKGEKIL